MKAESYFYEAAIRGNTKIQTYLGDRLIFKHKGRETEGKHLLECALQQEHWDTADRLSAYYHHKENNNRKSLEYVLLGINNGNKASITSLALEYVTGDGIVKESKEKADCLRGLRKELKADPDNKFPDVEERCSISYVDLLSNRKYNR